MEKLKEYITVERKAYNIMQNKLNYFEKESSNESLIRKVENKEGIIVFKEDTRYSGIIGFITPEDLKQKLDKILFYERIPKWLKFIIEKLWKKN